jgi:hypothetical protein
MGTVCVTHKTKNKFIPGFMAGNPEENTANV